jgi:hypothetical protein
LKQEISTIASQTYFAEQPIEQIRQDLNLALGNSGYTSKDSMIELVRDVKREMQAEQESN